MLCHRIVGFSSNKQSQLAVYTVISYSLFFSAFSLGENLTNLKIYHKIEVGKFHLSHNVHDVSLCVSSKLEENTMLLGNVMNKNETKMVCE